MTPRTAIAAAAVAAALAAPAEARTTFAVIGDTPYGAEQVADHANLVAALNADRAVQRVLHVGDIKNGSMRCDTAYFEQIKADWEALEDPLAYTPGDNEWTDCHRPSNGAHDPLERLAQLRATFFAEAGRTLGGRGEAVRHQDGPTVENVQWVRSGTVFATVHAVGSQNGRAPWTVDDPARRLAEVEQREAAALAWIDAAFDRAAAEDARAVVLAMQADTHDPATGAVRTGFGALVERLTARAAAFARPVLVLQGDSHRFRADRPFAGAPLVQRIVVEGETTREHLRVTIDGEALRWERVRR